MASQVDTSVRRFSAGYAMTEFELRIGEFTGVQISSYRAEDIRQWWYGGAESSVPVVLRNSGRHFVPEESDDLDYESIRVPADMADEHMDVMFLLPNEGHVRRLMGFSDE